MKKRKWFAVEITIEPKFSEAIEFAFNELASNGSEINNLGKNLSDDIFVNGYFDKLPNDELLKKHLQKALEIYNFPKDSIKNISVKEIENRDWLAEWKKFWKPTETEKFIIAPPWENIENTKKVVIKIEPNMAFGTGTHETTKLCLKAIEENYESRMSFFDVGTGTGILAIAVSKLATEDTEKKDEKKFFKKQSSNKKQFSKNSVSSVVKIFACDVDEDSIKIAKENAELNNTGEIKFYVGSISEDSPKFDFVCANITADVIIPMLPLLIKKTQKILVLSGILSKQKNSVLSELKKLDIEDPEVQTDGEWISIIIST